MKYLEQLLIETGGNHLCIEYMCDPDGYAVTSIIIHDDKLDEIPWPVNTLTTKLGSIMNDANKWLDICYQDLLAFNKKFNAYQHMSDYSAVIYSRETP